MPSINNPRQVILVSSRADIEIMGRKQVKDDIITLAWHMPASFNPELYAISIGKTRFSHKLISDSKVFVINFIPYELKKQALFCGTRSGEHIDKFKEAGLTKEEAEKIDCPRIKEAIAYHECEAINQIDTGDHTIFIGKIVNSELKANKKRLFQGDSSLKGHGFTTTE